MKGLFILYTVFCSFQIIAQSSKIDANIKKLNNSQFNIVHGASPAFTMKSTAAHKLIKIGRPAAGKLMAALNDSTKVIMAHLVLCHIWFDHASFAGPKKVNRPDGEIYKYYLGEEKGEGLLITESENPAGVFKTYIELKDLETIKAYWKKKTTEPPKSTEKP